MEADEATAAFEENAPKGSTPEPKDALVDTTGGDEATT